MISEITGIKIISFLGRKDIHGRSIQKEEFTTAQISKIVEKSLSDVNTIQDPLSLEENANFRLFKQQDLEKF